MIKNGIIVITIGFLEEITTPPDPYHKFICMYIVDDTRLRESSRRTPFNEPSLQLIRNVCL